MNDFPKCLLWSDERSEPLINQLPTSETNGLREQMQSDGSILISFQNKKARATRLSLGLYNVIVVSADPDYIKSKKKLEAAAELILSAAYTLDSSYKRSEDRTRRLIHNLKSLTAKIGQEVFYIAQQDLMINSPRDMVKYITKEILDNTDDAAKGLIEILKHHAAQKAEYSAFEKLTGKASVGAPERHDIHRVLMNVFYLFFGDFIKRKVKAEVERTRLQALIDYESIHVCIYYIIENASKYVRVGSPITVSTADDNGFVVVRFSMESLEILPEEVNRIFDEGFSGKRAIEGRLNGAGIGLYMARAMAQMNGGTLTVVPGRGTGAGYARNTFILALPH